jgi:hypothetical protein
MVKNKEASILRYSFNTSLVKILPILLRLYEININTSSNKAINYRSTSHCLIMSGKHHGWSIVSLPLAMVSILLNILVNTPIVWLSVIAALKTLLMEVSLSIIKITRTKAELNLQHYKELSSCAGSASTSYQKSLLRSGIMVFSVASKKTWSGRCLQKNRK